MTEEALRAMIDQHICVVAGVPYRFRLAWCGTEKHVRPVLARKLINVECIATAESAGERVGLNLVVLITNLSDLPALLDDALLMHAHPAAPNGANAAHREKTALSTGGMESDLHRVH